MISKVFGITNGSPSTSATNYVPLMSVLSSTPTATETARFNVSPASFTLKNLYISLNAAPGTGKSYTFKIRKNQVDTGISITISDSATSGSDLVDTVSIAAGDKLTLSMTPSGTPTAPTLILWNLEADSGGTHYAQLMGGGETNAPNGAVNYSHLVGNSNLTHTWSTTEAQQQIVCPCAGTISNLYVIADAAPGTSKSFAIGLMQNGSATSLVATVSGAATSANDTTHSVSVNAGDTLSIISTPTGTPTGARYKWGLRFAPSNAGESFFGFGSVNAAPTSGTNFELPLSLGADGWSTTESAARKPTLGASKITALYASLGTAPGAGTSRILTLRRNGIDTPATVTIANTATTGSITGLNIGLTQSDLLSLKATVSGTPATDTNGVHIGVLINIPVALPSKLGGFLAFMV